jgi:hypothetical protein
LFIVHCSYVLCHFGELPRSELEGAAYRNADFMKQFEDGGKAVRIERPERISVDITALP